MNRETIKMLFEYSFLTLQQNLDGIDHEESMIGPEKGGNCINWVLGHILLSRNAVLKLVEAEPIWPPEEGLLYERGSSPLDGRSHPRSLDRLLGDLNTSQERLMAALDRMKEHDLQTGTDGMTRARQISAFHFHEAYHSGQIGVLRRFIGKTGAIR
ncbi:MAG: DinB family protein [Armatimonadetes bacterium]|nr:DinB family protein [Armatimonadota bacterium]